MLQMAKSLYTKKKSDILLLGSYSCDKLLGVATRGMKASGAPRRQSHELKRHRQDNNRKAMHPSVSQLPVIRINQSEAMALRLRMETEGRNMGEVGGKCMKYRKG